MYSKTELIQEILSSIKKKRLTKDELTKLKTRLCKKHGVVQMPTDIEILLNAAPEDAQSTRRLQLVTKPTRTLSGVAVIAIMSKPLPCPHVKKGIGPCIYCPGGPDSAFGTVPQSYTGKEPATMRALRNEFDPYLQIMNRLEQYIATGHVPEKTELIIMGGTFPSFPQEYQTEFVAYAFKAMNDFSDLFYKNNVFDFIKFKQFFELPGDIKNTERIERVLTKVKLLKKLGISQIKKIKNGGDISLGVVAGDGGGGSLNEVKTCLQKEHKRNETAKIKCIGLTLETRPDYGLLKEGNEMLRLGCTKVELGVQTVYDNVLKKIRRGHTVNETISSTRILKDLGFKINYHIMLGLPGVSKEQDLEALKTLFDNPDFRPDMLKIYPCMVMKGTKLYDEWKNNNFKPITTTEAAEIISEFKRFVPDYCRIMRVQRDIPTFVTEAGVDRTNLRQYVQELAEYKGIKCRCIRCREIGRSMNIGRISIYANKYEASRGLEIFISAEDKENDVIAGFCRLRFPSQQLRKEITGKTALVRELHVYGTSVGIGEKAEKHSASAQLQHRGIGKRLLAKAESIAKECGKNKIVVISAVGAREYYKKLGYRREGSYMVKYLKKE